MAHGFMVLWQKLTVDVYEKDRWEMSRREEKFEGGRNCTNSLAAPADEGQRAVAEKTGLHKSAAVPHRSANNNNNNHPRASNTKQPHDGRCGSRTGLAVGLYRLGTTHSVISSQAIGAPARPDSRSSENTRFGVRRTLGPLSRLQRGIEHQVAESLFHRRLCLLFTTRSLLVLIRKTHDHRGNRKQQSIAVYRPERD
jgi:hypothetical protein